MKGYVRASAGRVGSGLFGSALAALFMASSAIAQDVNPPEEQVKPPKAEYSPFVGDHFPTRPLFGDTHLHTSWSADAGVAGATLGPDEAYRVSRGETVTSFEGWQVKLHKPLDWVVVADHAEYLGLADFLSRSDPLCLANETCKRWHDMSEAGNGYEAFLEMVRDVTTDQINEPGMVGSIWSRVLDNADKYYEPGVFTTFTGFEWSPHLAGDNMHRVIIFRDGAERTRQVLPFSAHKSIDPEDLWRYMAGYEAETGGRVLTLAHNGNLSNGKMFDTKTWTGQEFTRDYAVLRSTYEPLYEATQIKGDGEAHPFLSPNDEFADFGTWDKGNLNLSVPKSNDMLAGEYARSGLKLGLQLENDLGVNPFKYGMIGSTDSHTALATADDDNFFGKHSGSEPSPERMTHPFAKFGDLEILGWETLASGYAAVWATENTREALFDAMERKETYATTGPRMLVRFFDGWDFEAADATSRQPAAIGYRKGVPMGGDLSNAPAGKSPSFLVAALKDPIGANLDRVQIIKGWMDSGGELQERAYDVAVSDGRQIGSDGRARTPVGNTVDVANASWTNTIGGPELITVWLDPDFDPNQRAFYYVRVLEIPTPRWTAYDAKYFGLDDVPDEVEMVAQQRAYTSPIWYTP